MSFNISNIAAKGLPKEEILNTLFLECIDESESSDGAEEMFWGFDLVSGWYLIRFHSPAYLAVQAYSRIAELSRRCQVVELHVVEGVNASESAGWQNGEMAWSLKHDLENGSPNLIVRGTPPKEFEKLRDCLRRKHENPLNDLHGNYYFSIPPGVVTLLTGFGYRRMFPPTEKPMDILRPQKEKSVLYIPPTESQVAGRSKSPPPEKNLRTPEEDKVRLLLSPAVDMQHLHMYEDALVLLDKIIAENGSSIPIQFVRAISLRELNRNEEYRELLNSIAKSEAKTAADYYYRSIANYELGTADGNQRSQSDNAKALELSNNKLNFLMY